MNKLPVRPPEVIVSGAPNSPLVAVLMLSPVAGERKIPQTAVAYVNYN